MARPILERGPAPGRPGRPPKNRDAVAVAHSAGAMLSGILPESHALHGGPVAQLSSVIDEAVAEQAREGAAGGGEVYIDDMFVGEQMNDCVLPVVQRDITLSLGIDTGVAIEAVEELAAKLRTVTKTTQIHVRVTTLTESVAPMGDPFVTGPISAVNNLLAELRYWLPQAVRVVREPVLKTDLQALYEML